MYVKTIKYNTNQLLYVKEMRTKMRCLRCMSKELVKQNSEQYPYVCPECGTAYKKWVAAPKDYNKVMAMDSTFNYWHPRCGRTGDIADKISPEEIKTIRKNIRKLSQAIRRPA
jgi:predicted RNA-binding Zn-ribbon protein involved in translation (DUF1610 family)